MSRCRPLVSAGAASLGRGRGGRATGCGCRPPRPAFRVRSRPRGRGRSGRRGCRWSPSLRCCSRLKVKLRFRSTPRLLVLAQKALLVFLRHDSPASAFLRPSGLACSIRWTSWWSRIQVASALTAMAVEQPARELQHQRRGGVLAGMDGAVDEQLGLGAGHRASWSAPAPRCRSRRCRWSSARSRRRRASWPAAACCWPPTPARRKGLFDRLVAGVARNRLDADLGRLRVGRAAGGVVGLDLVEQLVAARHHVRCQLDPEAEAREQRDLRRLELVHLEARRVVRLEQCVVLVLAR
jgi:hypothetical protein